MGSAQGKLVTLALKTAPFPSSRRQGGFSSDGVDYNYKDHYADSSVRIYFPKQWHEGSAINLVFFFHGWFSSVDDSLDKFDLLHQFSDSGVNALLVLPETARDAPDSFGGKLETDNGFRDLVTEVLKTLHDRRLIRGVKAGRIVLAGHSGAYRVISQILASGGLSDHIKEVLLFDALYGDLDDFEAWLKQQHGRLVSVFTVDGDAAAYNRTLINALSQSGVTCVVLDEASVGAKIPVGARAIFFRSQRDHYGVVSEASQFQFLLQHSLIKKQ